MFGLLHALETVATLLLMCDSRDLGTAIGENPPAVDASSPGAQHSLAYARDRAAPLQSDDEPVADVVYPRSFKDSSSQNVKEFFEPNLYLYDAYPGGIGFSEPLFRAHDLLVQKTRELIASCGCEQGCPSCVGPAGDLAPRAKEAALAILERLLA
jgi:DEAD/DEAH box helicase domain-containing protein